MKIEDVLNDDNVKKSSQVMEDGSTFHTFIWDEYRMYITHYAVISENKDQMLISLWKGINNILNFSGTVTEVCREFRNTMYISK